MHTWTITRSDQLSLGTHDHVDLPLVGGLADNIDKYWYVVQIVADPSIVERTTDNNDAATRIRGSGLCADYDADETDNVFGNYIRGVSLDNQFTLNIDPEYALEVTDVQVFLGTAPITATRLVSGVYEFTLDMGELTADSTDLKYDIYVGSELKAESVYTINTFRAPAWLDPLVHTDDDVRISVKWNETAQQYIISRTNMLVDFKAAIPAGIQFLGGKMNEFWFGQHLIFGYGLDGLVKWQDAGPSFGLTILGANIANIDLPVTTCMLGRPEFTLVVSDLWKLKQLGLDAFTDEKVADAFKDMVNVTNGHGASSDDKHDPMNPGAGLAGGSNPSWKFDPTVELKAFQTPFVISKSLELVDGEYGAKVAIKQAFAVTIKVMAPVLGWFAQLVGNLTGGIELGGEISGGLKASGGELTTSGSISIYAKPFIELGGYAQLLYGVLVKVGVKGTAEIAPTLTFPAAAQGGISRYLAIPAAVKAELILSEFFDVFQQQLWVGYLFKSDDILRDKNLNLFPEKKDPPALKLLSDGYEPNDSFDTATYLGAIAGSSSLTGLTLSNAGDSDYYRFNLLEDGVAGNDIQLAFDADNPLVSAELVDASGVIVAHMSFTDARTGKVSLAGRPAGEYRLIVEGSEDLGIGYNLNFHAPTTDRAALISEIQTSLDSKYLTPGQVFDVTVKTTNAGTAASSPCEAALVWSKDNLIDTTDGLLTPSAIALPSLLPGQTWMQTYHVALPTSVLGSAWIGLLADRRETVDEACRGDNIATENVEVDLSPDRYEINDSAGLSRGIGGIVGPRTVTGLNIASDGDVDWYSFQLSTAGTSEDAISILRNGSRGQVKMLLVDAQGNKVALDGDLARMPDTSALETADGPARISLVGLPAGKYYFSVAAAGEGGFEYDIAIDSAERTKPNLAVDGDGDGTAGGAYILNFHRLYGDATGDGSVNDVDLQTVTAAIGSANGGARFDPNADLDRNGLVTARDLAAVKTAMGRGITPSDATLPQVASVTVQDSTLMERSYVDRLQVTFDEGVNVLELISSGGIESAMKLTNLGGNADSDADKEVSLTSGQFQYDSILHVLTWSLDAFAGGGTSLDDGYYRLRIDGAALHDAAGNPLDGDGDGTGGDDFTFDFHRLAGDVNGDALVDQADLTLVRDALGSVPGKPDWNADADTDRNGYITVRDLALVNIMLGNAIILPGAAAQPAPAIASLVVYGPFEAAAAPLLAMPRAAGKYPEPVVLSALDRAKAIASLATKPVISFHIGIPGLSSAFSRSAASLYAPWMAKATTASRDNDDGMLSPEAVLQRCLFLASRHIELAGER